MVPSYATPNYTQYDIQCHMVVNVTMKRNQKEEFATLLITVVHSNVMFVELVFISSG